MTNPKHEILEEMQKAKVKMQNDRSKMTNPKHKIRNPKMGRIQKSVASREETTLIAES